MSNQVNSTKVVTGKVRFCYVNVFEPPAMKEGDTPKYNICVLIPKSDTATIDKIKKAIEAAKEAGKAKLADKNGRIPANLKLPLRDGDEERPDDPAFEDHYFINANSMRQPSIVDHSLNPIMSRGEFFNQLLCFQCFIQRHRCWIEQSPEARRWRDVGRWLNS